MKLGAKNQPSLSDLFSEDSEILKEAFKSMADAIKAYVEGNEEKKQKKIEETIQLEKKQDRLREEITERIFSKETMVFSREDRLNLIDDLDDVVDLAEIVVRKMSQFNPKVPEEFKNEFNQIANALIEIGEEMHLLVQAVLKDFQQGKPHTIRITDIRRAIRELRWNLLGKTYQIEFPYVEFHFFQTFIKAMSNVADEAEELSDEIYALICKYTF